MKTTRWNERIIIFLKERYAPSTFLFIAILNALSLLILAEKISTTNFLMLLFNFFSFPLLMRVCDEEKDLESDMINCPERCIPRGDVSIQDVLRFGKILFFIFSLINILWIYVHELNYYPLIALIIYLYLFYKYFFLRKIVSDNLIIALLLSNPITWLSIFYNLYLISPYHIITLKSILISTLLWSPCWFWEIARKIRLPQDETAYQTYSQIFGWKLSLSFPFIGLMSMAIFFSNITQHHTLGLLSYVISIFYLIFAIFALKVQNNFFISKIRPVTEACISCFNILIICSYFK